MEGNGRQSDGRFAHGHKFSKGRPPRNYSIASAVSAIADTPETIDNEGNTLTKAQLAARWLWDRVLDDKLSFRDRLEAFKSVRACIEPDFKLKDEHMGDNADPVSDDLSGLTNEELDQLERLIAKGARSE